MAPLTWLVTGATSGIGAALIDQILARGDKVIASGRSVEKRLGHLQSENLALLELDITNNVATISNQIAKAWKVFGNIDIIINNAGMSAMRSAEEADEAFVNNMFQVNYFGHVRVTQAILPLLRAQGHGCIAFTSSSTVWAPLPFMAHYAASKSALSAYVESLHKEVRPFGLRCIAFECGGFPTNLGQPRDSSQASFGSSGPGIQDYVPLFTSLVTKFATNPTAHMSGDVSRGAGRIVDIITREKLAAGKPWPVRVALGSDGLGSAKQRCEEQLKLAEIWKDVSLSTDRDEAQVGVANAELFEFTTVFAPEDK